jgi:hypothetical protein
VESAEEGSAMKEIRASGTVLMQTKGGGKHDILPVGRATATTPDCMWMMPRDPDADMCPGTETVPVSTEECMAHQSCVPSADHLRGRSNHGAVRRALSQDFV